MQTDDRSWHKWQGPTQSYPDSQQAVERASSLVVATTWGDKLEAINRHTVSTVVTTDRQDIWIKGMKSVHGHGSMLMMTIDEQISTRELEMVRWYCILLTFMCDSINITRKNLENIHIPNLLRSSYTNFCTLYAILYSLCSRSLRSLSYCPICITSLCFFVTMHSEAVPI